MTEAACAAPRFNRHSNHLSRSYLCRWLIADYDPAFCDCRDVCIANKRFDWVVLRESLAITVWILLIVAAETMFMSVFAANRGARLIRDFIEGAGVGTIFFLLVVFVLDWTANVLICVPLFAPFIRSAGIGPIWFATLALIVIHTGYLTPPMACSIFYLKSIAPPDMTCGRVLPFIGLQVLALILIVLTLELAIWQPDKLIG